MHMKYESEVLNKKTRVLIQKPCCLQTDRQMDKAIQANPTNFVGRGYNDDYDP